MSSSFVQGTLALAERAGVQQVSEPAGVFQRRGAYGVPRRRQAPPTHAVTARCTPRVHVPQRKVTLAFPLCTHMERCRWNEKVPGRPFGVELTAPGRSQLWGPLGRRFGAIALAYEVRLARRVVAIGVGTRWYRCPLH